MNNRFCLSLASLALVLMLVVGSCASPPAPEPAPPAPTHMPTPSPAPAPTPSPSPEPEKSDLSELNLVVEPLAEKRLDVAKIYSGGEGPGLCYMGSYAMLAHYADDTIAFSDVIASSGIGGSACYVPEINLLLDGFEIGAMALAAGNQGFDYYLSALEGAQLTDEFFAMNLVDDARQIISVLDEDEAFDLLKRLISSDIPVMVHLDINYIEADLVAHCPYWQTIFDWQRAHMGAAHIDHYMSVNGYDDGFVYMNDPTEKQEGMGQDIPVNISSFLEAWQNGNHPSLSMEARIGPYWMLFLGKRGTARSAAELIAWNKDIAAEAISPVRQAAVKPNVMELMHCNDMFRARQEFGVFLQENGYPEAGEMFLEISELFGGLCRSSDQKADLLKIADLQEQSLDKW